MELDKLVYAPLEAVSIANERLCMSIFSIWIDAGYALARKAKGENARMNTKICRKTSWILMVALLAVMLLPNHAALAGLGDLYVLGGGGGEANGSSSGGGGGGAGGYIGDTDPGGHGGGGFGGQGRGSGGTTGAGAGDLTIYGGGAMGFGGGGNGGNGGNPGQPGSMGTASGAAGGGAGGGTNDAGSGGGGGGGGAGTTVANETYNHLTVRGGGGGGGGSTDNTGIGGGGGTGLLNGGVLSIAGAMTVEGGKGGNGSNNCPGGSGGAATVSASAISVGGSLAITSGSLGSNGAGGVGGAASLQCAGTLSASSITVTKNDGAASANIGTLLVAAGGTTVTNNGGTVTIGTIKFDSVSTTLSVSGTVGATNVSLAPPTTANGGATAFSATGFASGALSVDTGNLSLNPGETITLLTTTGGVPAGWNGQTFGDYKTVVSGTKLLLRRNTNTPISTPKPPSSLPKTGDGFPLYAMLALFGIGLVGMGYAGMRLGKGKSARKRM